VEVGEPSSVGRPSYLTAVFVRRNIRDTNGGSLPGVLKFLVGGRLNAGVAPNSNLKGTAAELIKQRCSSH
jgi:hypothetical protein